MSIRKNPIAYLALFIALGGTSYAALKLPTGSVGTRQLRNGAVTNAKVKKHSLRRTVFAHGVIPAAAGLKTTAVVGPLPPFGPGCPADAPGPGCGEPYPADYSFTNYADCPSGDVVIGGGYTIPSDFQGSVVASASEPSGTQAWTVTFTTISQVDGTHGIPGGSAEAVCAAAHP